MHSVQLFDTTLRDGTQGEGVSFSVDDKLRIAERLDEFGIHFIEGGWPGSNPKDVEFFERAKQLRLKQAMLVAFGSTRKAGIRAEGDTNLLAIVNSGVKAAAIFGKSWDFHVAEALRTTLDENLRMIADSVAFLKASGLTVIYDAEHFFDGYKHNPEYAMKTLRAAAEAGADVLALCDTNGGSLPNEVEEFVRIVVAQVSTRVGIHCHNDSGVAVANTLVAIGAGAGHVQGTINGVGERCGNVDLCQVIPNLQLKMGRPCVADEQLGKLTELSHYVSEMANMSLNARQPFVGRSVFAHKGGIHVSALLRHPETYEHIRPELVGNHRRVLVSELSGVSNILYKAQECDIPLEKDSPALRQIVEQVKSLEHQGYSFEGAEASFELVLKKAVDMYQPLFELHGFRLVVEKRAPDEEPVAEATIKVQVGDRIVHTVAEGDGPVNALDNALRKALEQVYPHIRNIKLTDYKVRVLNENGGTAAKVRVLITSSDEERSWGTVGVSSNIIEASWQALVDSIEYSLLQRGVTVPEVEGTPATHAAEATAGRRAIG